MSINTYIFILTALTVTLPAAADEPFQLGLPIACLPGKDCWIVHYLDVDPGPGAEDYACGRLTYEGHKGVDFAIRDAKAMQTGVPVLAAQAGVVKAIRDGVIDREATAENLASVESKECGNGIIIDHGDGWTSQYCHLRQNSLQVRPGAQVAAGQRLGLVGLSGQTEFPHLHFTVRRQNELVDPFTGIKNPTACGDSSRKPLWKAEIQPLLIYRPVAIYNLGFTDKKVTSKEIRAGQYQEASLSKQAPALVFWIDAFGIYPQDKLTLRIKQPDGGILVQHVEEMEKFYIRRFQFIGKNKSEEAWPPGIYRGEAIVVRQTATGPKEFKADKSIEVR